MSVREIIDVLTTHYPEFLSIYEISEFTSCNYKSVSKSIKSLDAREEIEILYCSSSSPHGIIKRRYRIKKEV